MGVVASGVRKFASTEKGTSDEALAAGELACHRAEAEHGERPAVGVVDGVTQLGAVQGPLAEVVVRGGELVPALAVAAETHDGAKGGRADLIEPGWRREWRRLGVRSEDHGSVRDHGQFGSSTINTCSCTAGVVTLAVMSLSPSPNLSHLIPIPDCLTPEDGLF